VGDVCGLHVREAKYMHALFGKFQGNGQFGRTLYKTEYKMELKRHWEAGYLIHLAEDKYDTIKISCFT
jgi:hypothetical protein